MYIYGRYIVHDTAVLILYLTGSVGITAVILIGITVNYDLGCGSYYRSSLNRIGLPYTASYSLAIALRYVPDVQTDFSRIKNAQEENNYGYF